MVFPHNHPHTFGGAVREPASGIALPGSLSPCTSKARRYLPNERQATDYCAVAERSAQARKGILFPAEPPRGICLHQREGA